MINQNEDFYKEKKRRRNEQHAFFGVGRFVSVYARKPRVKSSSIKSKGVVAQWVETAQAGNLASRNDESYTLSIADLFLSSFERNQRAGHTGLLSGSALRDMQCQNQTSLGASQTQNCANLAGLGGQAAGLSELQSRQGEGTLLHGLSGLGCSSQNDWRRYTGI